ncbi:MAG: hypothetical protein KA100_04880 [Rickettsiales bacterium]|nr:hypothetical protein [Rickettsiales bacterium]
MKLISDKKTAYSLLELSIVITIVAIMISGGLSFLTSSTNNAKIQLTRERMGTVYKALGSYLVKNKSLPCPALITAVRSSETTYGQETPTPGTCSGTLSRDTGALVAGAVPVQALGLSADFAEDGFGSKFTYVVAKAFTNPDVTISDVVGFGRATATNIITVNDRIDSGLTQLATSNAVFVLVSSGVNKLGAYSKNSSVASAAPTDADELSNYSDSGGTSGKVFFASSAVSDVFDDMLIFKTRDELVLDFDALDLIVCRASDGNQTIDYGTPTSFTWPQTRYSQISAANEDCPVGPPNYKVKNAKPLKRCGAFGVWDSDPSTPCHAS